MEQEEAGCLFNHKLSGTNSLFQRIELHVGFDNFQKICFSWLHKLQTQPKHLGTLDVVCKLSVKRESIILQKRKRFKCFSAHSTEKPFCCFFCAVVYSKDPCDSTSREDNYL